MTDERQGAMPKAYQPAEVEGRLYRMWEEAGYFTPQGDPSKEPFVIIMPPPNLTGELHLGHALTDTVEDILIRWHRMRGEPTLWLPGIDHAAIAVHVLVERDLASEGLTRHDIGREAFLERVWEFVNKSRARIFDQHRRLGASADWTRERFTMDPGPTRAVRTAFYQLYQNGLIYRGERLINWCPRCQTALSDLEVDHEERDGHLWHVRYPLIDGAGKETGEFITIATTRPETIVADVAIAVHPKDDRCRALVGGKARLPIIGRELVIVADEAIEKEFGTGALKVTPGHDQTDFEIGQRHALPIVNAINPDGTMNDEAGPYAGMDRFACREAIVRDLDRQGLLVKTEDYRHAVGTCDRCDTVVEPLISEQWFVAVNKEYAPGRSLAGEALQVVNDGHIRFLPPRFTKIYTNWMENIRDWCISRQLWWGHRVPVWYCDGCGATNVPPPEVETPSTCEQCGGASLRQDDDTLDTWFSSGLWPISTLGWPDDTEDLRRLYPTAVMETAYEIIFFWVARMIMMCQFAMNDRQDDVRERIPFKFVYLHGLVRDDDGQKMSKTRGNVVDPLSLMDTYGTDALRFSIVTASGMGQDQRLQEDKIEAGRNFANKLWNAARFVVMQLDGSARVAAPSLAGRASLPAEDRWILSRLDRLVGEVDHLLTEFQLNEAGHRIYDFLWGDYCDWYVEMAKVRLRGEGQSDPRPVLVHVLETGLRLLHPYMPFVTEELWQRLRPFLADAPAEALIVAPFPQSDPSWRNEQAERDVEAFQSVVNDIRDVRAVERISHDEWFPRVRLAVQRSLEEERGRIENDLRKSGPWIRHLTRVQVVDVVDDVGVFDKETEIPLSLPMLNGVLTLPGSHSLDVQRVRLRKEKDAKEAYLTQLEAKLANEQFRTRAPRELVVRDEERASEARAQVDRLRRALERLGEGPL